MGGVAMGLDFGGGQGSTSLACLVERELIHAGATALRWGGVTVQVNALQFPSTLARTG